MNCSDENLFAELQRRTKRTLTQKQIMADEDDEKAKQFVREAREKEIYKHVYQAVNDAFKASNEAVTSGSDSN